MENPFPPSSRYHTVDILTRAGPDGEVQTYLARRVLPAPQRFVPFDRVRLTGSERADLLAAVAYGEPALWWRIADANGDPDPADLGGPQGRLLVIPLPIEVASDGDA